MESKVSDAEGRARTAEATLSEAMLEAGRQIQAANEVARKAQEQTASERARARDLVARERVAMKVKAAEFDKDTAQAQ